MKRSQVVIALADVASKGKYEVDPKGAGQITAIYQAVAQLINELEAEEAAAEADKEAE